MVGETNGPNEHEVRMATSKHKLDDLLAFVHMMVKRDAKMETRREKMAKVPTVKCRKDVFTSTWTRCQGHQHHQNLRGEIPNWMVRSMA
jgi:hypothetical protein